MGVKSTLRLKNFMSTDPEDPNDNPWDARIDDTKSKRGKKTPEQPVNPWAKQDGTSPFRKPIASSNSDDPFSSFIEQIKKSGAKFRGNRGGNYGSGNNSGQRPPANQGGINNITIITGAVVGLALWLSTGVFRVQEGEIAVILRFGKMIHTAGPGLHYRLPSPFEREIVKNVSELKKIDSISNTGANTSFDKTLVLTGDENMVHINYTVLWKIKDVKDFLFSVRAPEDTILAAADSIVREVMGQTTARAALTQERDSVATKAQDLLQKVLDHYKIGVLIVSVQLQKVDAPSEVINAFNDMQASLTDGDRMLHEANAYHFEIVPRARGESSKIIQEAEGYSQEVVSRAQGEADRFNCVYTEYKKNPEVSRKRLYLDTMEHVLSHVHKTIIDPKAAPGLVPYFHLQPGASADKKQG